MPANSPALAAAILGSPASKHPGSYHVVCVFPTPHPHDAGGELSSCSQLDTNRSAQLLDVARSLGEDEAAAATAVAATAAGTRP